jgi:arylsulfatase A-like enzyme
MAGVRNVLFIMCDQLRADYLSCYGHATLATPNLDRLAARGTRFTHAYSQAPICTASRMSLYTGRYVFSHGATWNFVPLPVGERTLGDYLRPLGLRVAVAGKTHHEPDREGMRRLGVSDEEQRERHLDQGGFEPYWRDDGLHPDDRTPADLEYNQHLRRLGYGGANPWHEWANSALSPEGELASGWYCRNAHLPARVPEEHSETAFATDRALAFIAEQGERPWCLHLSYIKPHWPYIAPSPYHGLFDAQDVQPPVRAAAERGGANPVVRGFQEHPESVAFSEDRFRLHVAPAYMGLVKQIDHHVGRLLDHLEKAGRLADTLVVFTSDHGDFLGDHWQGEKEMMYESSVRLPLIIADPSAEAKRGAVSDALVEAIDLLPTFIEALGAVPPAHVLEGQSLLPHLRGGPAPPRDAVYSELDYAIYPAARRLGLGVRDARMVMVRSRDWKYVDFGRAFPAQLFNLRDDPGELTDLGADPARAGTRDDHLTLMREWMRRRRNRVAIDDETISRRTGPGQAGGVIIGRW